MSHIRQVSLDELRDHLREHRHSALAGHPVLIAVLHHTYVPTARDWAGKKTWEAIRHYHVRVRGWRDIGYHIGVAPDRSIWLLRPITMTGAHSLGRYQGYRVNDISIGIAMIGNYDVEDPELCLPTAVEVLATVCRVFGFSENQVYFHRDFQPKSCPGSRVSRANVRSRVAAILAGGEDQPPYPHRDDVSPWAAEAVKQAQNLGLLSGYPDGSFRGRQPVTREELAAALVRLYSLLEKEGR